MDSASVITRHHDINSNSYSDSSSSSSNSSALNTTNSALNGGKDDNVDDAAPTSTLNKSTALNRNNVIMQADSPLTKSQTNSSKNQKSPRNGYHQQHKHSVTFSKNLNGNPGITTNSSVSNPKAVTNTTLNSHSQSSYLNNAKSSDVGYTANNTQGKINNLNQYLENNANQKVPDKAENSRQLTSGKLTNVLQPQPSAMDKYKLTKKTNNADVTTSNTHNSTTSCHQRGNTSQNASPQKTVVTAPNGVLAQNKGPSTPTPASSSPAPASAPLLTRLFRSVFSSSSNPTSSHSSSSNSIFSPFLSSVSSSSPSSSPAPPPSTPAHGSGSVHQGASSVSTSPHHTLGSIHHHGGGGGVASGAGSAAASTLEMHSRLELYANR